MKAAVRAARQTSGGIVVELEVAAEYERRHHLARVRAKARKAGQ